MKNKGDHKLKEELIESALTRSYNYKEYRALVNDLAEKGQTTGIEQKDSLVNYTALNNRRMKRWDKTFKLHESDKAIIEDWNRPILWLVLTESWCGDAAPAIPVMNKIAEVSEKITFRLAMRDQNPELMNLFLTNGTRSIPKLIMVDKQSLELINSWGPRPTKATEMVKDYKKEQGELTPQFKQDLQQWYNKDKGQNILEDLLGLLALK